MNRPSSTPKEDEDAGDVVGKAELGKSHHRLECSPDRHRLRPGWE